MIQRVVTGLLVILLTAAQLAFGGLVIQISIAVYLLIACYEITHIQRVAGRKPIAWPVFMLFTLALPAFLFCGGRFLLPLLLLCLLFALCSATLLRDPHSEDLRDTALPFLYPAAPGLCLLYLSLFSPNVTRALLLLPILSAVGSDTFAFFIGCRWGKHKLVPQISPKKTIEGAWGGVFGAFLGAGAYLLLDFFLLKTNVFPLWSLPLWAVVFAFCAQTGDLIASSIKRYYGVKDFGTIFPGHGGVLDRLDSILLCGVPVCIYAMLCL